MSQETPDVEISRVTKEFGSVRALDDVDLSVAPGRFFSLLGPSGCGKTTLLRLIGGFEQPDVGSIKIVGTDVTRVPPNRRPTALVFQRWALFPHLTTVQNIGFGLKLRRAGRRELTRRVDELLDLVGLTGLGGRRPAQLSGGQQQRVALARALAIEPKVLLLDEPLSALDLKLRGQMQLELKRLQRDVGTTFLYVTHDQSEAMTMSDAIAVINGGRVEQVGAPQDIYDRPETAFVSTFIGDTNLLDVTAGDGALHLVGADGERADAIVPPSTADLVDGERHAVSVRHERVSIGRGLGTANTFTGKVTEAIFSGSAIRYLVRLDGVGLEVVAAVPYYADGQAYRAGEPVEVGWQPDAAVVVRS